MRLGRASSFLVFLVVAGCLGPSPSEPSSPPPSGTVEGSVPTYGDGNVLIRFHVQVPNWTRSEDRVFVYMDEHYFAPDGGMALGRVGDHEWEAVYRAQEGITLHYRYNRNDYGVPTHEAFVPDDPTAGHTFAVGKDDASIRDVVNRWRWLPARAPTAHVPSVEPILGRDRPFIVAVDLFDFYQARFTPFVNSTLDRIAGLGIRHVSLPVQVRTILSADPLQFTSEPINTPSRAQAEAILEAARARGIGLHLHAGIAADPNDLQRIDAALQSAHDDPWYLRSVEEWETAMRDWARWAESRGLDAMLLSNQWPFWGRPTAEQVPRLDGWIRAAIRNISAEFSGDLGTNYYDGSQPFEYYREFDWFGDKWTFPLSTANATDLAAMRAAARNIIDQHYGPLHERFGKPVFIPHVTYATYDGAAGGYRLPGEDSVVDERRPDDPRFPFDFQEQVDAYHAVLAELAATPWIVGASQFSFPYWDSVDKASSVRSKPAERVWANWAAAAEPS